MSRTETFKDVKTTHRSNLKYTWSFNLKTYVPCISITCPVAKLVEHHDYAQERDLIKRKDLKWGL